MLLIKLKLLSNYLQAIVLKGRSISTNILYKPTKISRMHLLLPYR